MGANIPFPQELIALSQPLSPISTAPYNTIHQQVSFPLPITQQAVFELDSLYNLVQQSDGIPIPQKQAIFAFKQNIESTFANNGAIEPPLFEQGQFEQVMAALGGLQGQIAGIQGQIDGIEGQFNGAQGQVGGIAGQLARVQAGIDRREARLQNVARAATRAPLQRLPLVDQQHPFPPAFVACRLRTLGDVTALAPQTLDATMLSYGLVFPNATTAAKAAAIWTYLGGSIVIADS